MTKIKVARAFTLTMDDGVKINVAPGGQNVSAAVADHWYTKAHLVVDDEALEEPDLPAEDRDALAKFAADLGIKVDGRWSGDRLKTEIAAVEAKTA